MNGDSPPKLSVIGRTAILGIGILPGIATSTISVMLPAISDAFANGTNSLQIKSVATATGLGMLIGAPISGLLLDRLGRRSVLLTAALLFGLFGCGVMLMSELWQIIGARFVVGLASGAMGVGVAALIGDHFDGPTRSRWLGLTVGSATLFLLAVMPIVGALTDIGWRFGFGIYALALPILVAIMLGIPGRSPATQPTGQRERLLPTLAEIPWRALLLAVFLGTLSLGTSLYWPFRMREVGIESSRDIAMYALPMVLITASAALGYGVIRRFLSVTQVFMAGAVLSAISLAAVAVAQTPLVIVLGLSIEGLAIGMLTPNLTTYALMVSPEDARGRVLGLVKGALYGSPFLSQFALEPIALAHGTWAAIATMSAAGVTIAIAVALGALGLSSTPLAKSAA